MSLMYSYSFTLWGPTVQFKVSFCTFSLIHSFFYPSLIDYKDAFYHLPYILLTDHGCRVWNCTVCVLSLSVVTYNTKLYTEIFHSFPHTHTNTCIDCRQWLFCRVPLVYSSCCYHSHKYSHTYGTASGAVYSSASCSRTLQHRGWD